MRVAIVNWSSRRVGGVEEYVALLIPALHQAGHDVAFWHELDAPVTRARIGVPQGALDVCVAESGIDASLELLRDWHPDVLYVHGISGIETERRLLDMAPAAYFVHSYVGTCISGGKAFTQPLVVPCERTFGWPCLAHYFPHGCGGRSPVTMWRQYRVQSDRLAMLRRYGALLTHSEHMHDEMGRHGLDAHVLPFAVEQRPLMEVPRSPSAWRLLFAGRMDALKGGEILLDALGDVSTGVSKALHVTFAGDGPWRERWESHARAVQAASPTLAIDFPGWVGQEHMGRLMQGADLLVVPSLWPEPFGSVGPQAAQYGVPAAAFAVGGISQWLEDGVTGHLAAADPPTSSGLAQAITRCLGDPHHHGNLRRGALKMAERFTMKRHVPALVESLERVAGGQIVHAGRHEERAGCT